MQEEIKRATVRKARQRIERYRQCFSSPDGQWVFADLKAAAGKPSYVPAKGMSFDQVAFNEGTKSILRRIEQLLSEETLNQVAKLETEILRHE